MTDERGLEPFRDGDAMVRSAQSWTPTVHALLAHIRDAGFSGAPQPFGIDGQWERVSFLPGTAGDLDNPEMGSEAALLSAGKLLRLYHDASVGFLRLRGETRHIWQLPPREPIEVICHGDFAPYNVVLRDGRSEGIIDFETAHPGPRLWDLAYAIYRWAPLSIGLQASTIETADARFSRARRFLDAYGLEARERGALPGLIVERLGALVAFMEQQAALGSEKYRLNIANGDDQLYRADMAYIRTHAGEIVTVLAG